MAPRKSLFSWLANKDSSHDLRSLPIAIGTTVVQREGENPNLYIRKVPILIGAIFAQMKDWVCIYSSPKLQDAEMIKGLLSFNEINGVVVNKQDSSYMFGDFEVHVNRNDVVKAKFVLKENNGSS